MVRRVPILLAAALVVAAAFARSSFAAVDVHAALRTAARGSGLAQLRPVAATVLPGPRFDSLSLRLLTRDYPLAAQRADAALYRALGLAGSLPAELRRTARAQQALFDAGARRVYVRAGTRDRAAVVDAGVRALADQHHRLGRLAGLRARDRDAAEAAEVALGGTAALAAREAPPAAAGGTPLHRFLSLERTLAVAAGRQLVSRLRFYGGARAARGALARPPATTAQALHLDLFLAREAPDGVAPLPRQAADAAREWTSTFGELDVRALLATFRVAGAAGVAAGWDGGRSGGYRLPDGTPATALALRWTDAPAATEWFGAVRAYVGAAFAGAADAPCRQTACWTLPGRALAFSFRGASTVLVSAATLADATFLADGLTLD